MPRIENEDFVSYNRFFLSLTYHTLQYQTSSESYTISDEKAKYQDFIIISCWSMNTIINFPSY